MKNVYCIIVTFLLVLVITTTVISDNHKKEQELYISNQPIDFGDIVFIEEIDIKSISINKDSNEYVIIINIGGGDSIEIRKPITQ